ncbi:hypothetical protein F4810DRAFT_714975 [Camillea tinctor]|nr:hypothetical protein F4810DRAFT_714975 [Camillea tinctor]
MISLSGLTVEIVQIIQTFDLSNIQVLDQVRRILSTKLDTNSGSEIDDAEKPGLEVVILAIVNLLIFLPVFFFLSYTLSELIPTLAAVECDRDHAPDAPPAYQHLSIKDDVGDEIEGNETNIVCPRPLASSLRITLYRLYSISGCVSLVCGLRYAIFVSVAMAGVSLGLSAFPLVPVTLGILGASLICSPLSTAWVHAVMSEPSSGLIWPRFSNLKTTYRATTLPTLTYASTVVTAHGVPHVIVLGDSLSGSTCRVLTIIALFLLLDVLLVIPSHIVLTRVQASLLPNESHRAV